MVGRGWAAGAMTDELDIIEAVFGRRPPRAELDRMVAAFAADSGDRLGDRLVDLLERVGAVAEMAERASDALSLDALVPALSEAMAAALGAERCTLFIHAPESRELVSRVVHGDASGEVRLPEDLGLAGLVFTSGEAVVVDDAEADPRFSTDTARRAGLEARTALCVPIRRRREVVGVVLALNKTDGLFTERDAALAGVLAAPMAAALCNALRHETEEEALGASAGLLDEACALASEPDLDSVLARFRDVVGDLADAERCCVFLHDAAADQLVLRFPGSTGVEEIRFPADAGIAGACFAGGEVINVPDAYDDPRFNREADRKAERRTRNILCVPLDGPYGARIGVVQLVNKRGEGPFDAGDEVRVGEVAAHAAGILRNAGRLEDALEQRAEADALVDALPVGVLALDPDRSVSAVNRTALDILGRQRDEVVGRPAAELFAGYGARAIQQGLDAPGVGNGVMRIEGAVDRGDGTTVPVRATVGPFGESAHGHGIVVVLEGIEESRD